MRSPDRPVCGQNVFSKETRLWEKPGHPLDSPTVHAEVAAAVLEIAIALLPARRTRSHEPETRVASFLYVLLARDGSCPCPLERAENENWNWNAA